MAASATWDLISKTTVGSNTQQVSVTGIPNTYTDLFVIGMWIQTLGANGMRVRVNTDTNNYYYQSQLFWAPTLSGTSSQQDNIFQTWITNGGTVLGKQFSIWQFSNYTSSKWKSAQWAGINYDANGVDTQTGIAATTSAISSIQFRNTSTDTSNDIAAGAIFYIYGIKAA